MLSTIVCYIIKYCVLIVVVVVFVMFCIDDNTLFGFLDQAEALTNVLRYHTCRSSLPEDRKVSISELKWDARTVTDIPGNNAYWFFAFFWLTKRSRNKN